MIYSILILLTILFVPNQNLKKYVDEYLKNKLSQYDKYEFKILKAPEIDGQLEIRNETKINLSSSFAYIPVKIIKPNSRIIQTYITIRLKLFKKVCIAKTEIEPGQLLSIEDFDYKLTNISDLRGTPIDSPDRLNGWRSKVKIHPGSVLLNELIEEIPVINKGDYITASAVSGSVKVSTDAEAKQDGVKGDIIIIVSKDKKQFKAKILDSNNVIIVE